MSDEMTLSLAVAPADDALLVDRAAAKTHLRILHTSEDAEIDALLIAAHAYAETLTGSAFRRATWELALPAFPVAEIRLPYPPLVSVSSITYRDSGGTSQTLDAGAYIVAKRRGCGRVVPVSSWPLTAAHPEAVVVRFVSGYAAADALDLAEARQAQHAIKLLVGHWYANREAFGDGKGAGAPPPHSVESLLSRYYAKGWV